MWVNIPVPWILWVMAKSEFHGAYHLLSVCFPILPGDYPHWFQREESKLMKIWTTWYWRSSHKKSWGNDEGLLSLRHSAEIFEVSETACFHWVVITTTLWQYLVDSELLMFNTNPKGLKKMIPKETFIFVCVFQVVIYTPNTFSGGI